MVSSLHQFIAFFRQHVLATALLLSCLLGLLLMLGAESLPASWPQKWQLHSRIRFGRLNHGRPEIFYYHPSGAWLHLPYLPGLTEQLRATDILSKEAATTRLCVIRDSAGHTLTLQWPWNEKTREFELAGRTSFMR